jgi:hypothetical protein
MEFALGSCLNRIGEPVSGCGTVSSVGILLTCDFSHVLHTFRLGSGSDLLRILIDAVSPPDPKPIADPDPKSGVLVLLRKNKTIR